MLIGTSTGGPAALDIVLPAIAGRISLAGDGCSAHAGELYRPFRPAARPRNARCGVVEVNRPMPLQAGAIYIGRGDADLIVSPRAAGANRDVGAGATRLSLASERGADGDQRFGAL